MRRNPIYVFESLDSLGIYNVPIGSTIQVNDADPNNPGKQPLTLQVVSKDGITTSSTIADFLAIETNYTNASDTTEIPSELEKITQNGKTGWRLLGMDPTKYGEIGEKAVDLSISEISTGFPLGATGNFSFAAGYQTEASGEASVAIGRGAKAKNIGQVVVGSFNTATKADTLFEVGIGGSASDRKDGLLVYADGSIEAPFSGITQINSRGPLALTTKEYVDASDASKVNIDGDIMSGDLTLDGANLFINKNSQGASGELKVQGPITVGTPFGSQNSTIYFNTTEHCLLFDNNIWDFAITKPGSDIERIWHTGNMGVNSGLNADLLDGMQPEELPISTATQAVLDTKFDKTGGSISGDVFVENNFEVGGNAVIQGALSLNTVNTQITFQDQVNVSSDLSVSGTIETQKTVSIGQDNTLKSVINFKNSLGSDNVRLYWDNNLADFFVDVPSAPASVIWHAGNFDPETKLDKTGGSITGNIDITGELTIGGTTTAQNINAQNITLTGDITASNNIVAGDTLAGGLLSIDGNATIDGTLNVNTNLFLTGQAQIGGNLSVQEDAVISGNLTADGLTVTTDIYGRDVIVAGVDATGDIIAGRALVTGIDTNSNSSIVFTDQTGTTQPVLYWDNTNKDLYFDRDSNTSGNEYRIWHEGNFDPFDPNSIPKSFDDLSDTPLNKTDSGGKYLRVSADGTRIIYDSVKDDSAIWGNITGVLTNQTDLRDVLDTKLNIAGGIITGNLTVQGLSTLTDITTTGILTAQNNAVFERAVDISGNLTANIAKFKEDATFDKDVNIAGILDVTSDTYLRSDAHVASDFTVGGSLNVASQATFQTDVSVQNNLNVQLSSVFNGQIQMKNGMVVDGSSTLNGKLTTNNDVDITGLTRIFNAFNVQGDATFSADVLVQTDMTVQGTSSLIGDVTAGANLTVTDNLNVLKQSNFNQNAHFLQNIDVQGTSLLIGDVTTHNSVSIGTALDVGTDATIGGDLNIAGSIAGSGSATIADKLTIASNGADITGNTTISGSISITGDISGNSGLSAVGDGSIGGNLSVGLNATILGNLTAAGIATFNNTLHVVDNATFDDDISVGNNISVTSNAYIQQNLEVSNGAVIGQQLTVNGPGVFNDSVSISKELTTNTSLQVNGPTQLNGTLTITGLPSFETCPAVEYDDGTGNAYFDVMHLGKFRAGSASDSSGKWIGLATLGTDGKIPTSQLPAIAITNVRVVQDIAERDSLLSNGEVQEGDVVKVTDSGDGTPGVYILDSTNGWLDIQESSDVLSVNGKTGAVVLTADDIAEGTSNFYYTDAKVDARISSSPINALSDVDTTSNTPNVGDTLVWDGANWVPSDKLTTIESSIKQFMKENFNGDGSTVGFTITGKVLSEADLDVYIDGLMQIDDGSVYFVSNDGSNTTITFWAAPANGSWIRVNYFA